MKLFEKNEFIYGIIYGILFPLIGYGIITGILWVISQFFDKGYDSWSFRTTALIALCFNLIPFQSYKKQRYDDAMRGVTVPTVILGIVWFFMHRDFIFGGL